MYIYTSVLIQSAAWVPSSRWLISDEHLFLTILEAEMSQIKALADLMFGEDLLPGLWQLSFCCAPTWWKKQERPWGLFYKGIYPIHEGTTLTIYFLKVPPANTVILGVRISTCKFGMWT